MRSLDLQRWMRFETVKAAVASVLPVCNRRASPSAICQLQTGRTLHTVSRTLSALIIAGATVVWAADSSTAETRAPKIQFAEKIFDFGEVMSGAVVQHDFVFTNAGNQPLEITDVRPSCGCTTTRAWDRRIEPGKRGVIPVQFNSSGFGGPVYKTVIVLSDDPVETNVVLQIKGTVRNSLEIMPSVVVFNASSETVSNETREVRIVNKADEPLMLSQPECTNRAFRVALETVRPGKEFLLRVTFDPPLTGAATITAPITLKSSSTNVPIISISAIGISKPSVVAVPAEITLPGNLSPHGTRMNITIRNNGANPLELSEPAMDIEGVTARIEEIQPGRLFTLALNFPAGFQKPSGRAIEARVKTNHPRWPVIRIPVVERKTLAALLDDRENAPSPADAIEQRSADILSASPKHNQPASDDVPTSK